MNIKDKIKSVWEKVTAKRAAKSMNNPADAELSADQVIEHEVFPTKTQNPSKAHAKSVRRAAATAGTQKPIVKKTTNAKPASKHSRPTNDSYRMIDPSDNSCDTGKS